MGDNMESFAKYIKDEKIVFKYARGESEKKGKEFHNYYEILYFLNGEATFISQDFYQPLKPYTLAVIPKETYHRFLFSGDEAEYKRCVFNFTDNIGFSELISKSMKNIAIIKVTEPIKFLFEKLIEKADKEYSKEIKINLMYSVLALLLDEISDYKNSASTVRKLNPVTKQSIKFIPENLCQQITVEDIANSLNVSSSTLSHIFKDDMKISIYKYILHKKLVLANKSIISGVPPTIAALDSGFNDYSGFYRQYKKMFGCSPSQKSVL